MSTATDPVVIVSFARTLISAMRASGGKKGMASLRIGGGEATAMAVELI